MIHDLNENPSLPFDEMNFIYQLDYALFETINNYAGRWPWLDAVARFLLNDYFVPTLMAVILLMLWFDGTSSAARSIKQRAVFVGALSAALANILLKVANLIYYRPRPFDVHEATLLFYEPTDSSLPSNAAALGFAIAASVWIYQRTWGWALLIVASFFGLSRVFGGVHYPFDVLAGAVLGCGSAWFIHKQKMTFDPLLHLIVRLASRFGLA
jgi:undecaprenyl-diphosphatase